MGSIFVIAYMILNISSAPFNLMLILNSKRFYQAIIVLGACYIKGLVVGHYKLSIRAQSSSILGCL